MGSLPLTEFDKKLIAQSRCLWSQKVVNHARRILEDCHDTPAVEAFFRECEENIKNPGERCRITFNTEVFTFGGDEHGYVWYFLLSEVLQAPIKIAVSFDPLEQTIVIGNMEIASKKEEAKLEKHLNTLTHTPRESVVPDK